MVLLSNNGVTAGKDIMDKEDKRNERQKTDFWSQWKVRKEKIK